MSKSFVTKAGRENPSHQVFDLIDDIDGRAHDVTALADMLNILLQTASKLDSPERAIAERAAVIVRTIREDAEAIKVRASRLNDITRAA